MTVSERDPAPTQAARPTHMPGDIHMWVMVLGDLFFFGSYFVAYMVFRAASPERFAAAQRHLSMGIGVTNTLVLLTSSMFVALAVISVRQRELPAARRLVLAAGACGVLFAALKTYEWRHAIVGGHTVAEEFFSFYFVLTGIHLAHLLLGLLILGIVFLRLRDPAAPVSKQIGIAEQGALYWHMIDLLWIVIFAVLYLMR
ncbi:nitric oxide reductase NorE protein [Nocardia transvalensis]|uniref:Cytochrome aa3 subunit 3 n=1 Tax=Nocardia transvalensis TaxID=37333 RepID=A0A7W9PFF9_9NOCA|nr:cytochrome c oxidase subunit 3 [Nocardia transvalensis]MBB5915204.1 nitric oxide reductase NorE protein [Nocardia transvalensis]